MNFKLFKKRQKNITEFSDSIIPRTLPKELSILLNDFASKIEDTVNLGANILMSDIKNENNVGGFENLPVLLFFRNFLEQLDACSILVKHSSIEPVNNLLRTALENFFYIEYLLEKDFKKRSMSFLVWNTFRTISFYEKTDGKSQSYKKIVESYKLDKIVSNFRPIILPNAEGLKKNSIEFLNQAEYIEITKEYKSKIDHGKRIEWYSLFNGPKNIRELSYHLKYPAFYNIIYQGLSHSIHGTNIIQGKISADSSNKANIYQIRLPLEIEFLVNLCITLSFHLYHDYTIKRLPHKVSDVEKWFVDLKPFLDSLKSQLIKINYSS